MKDRIILFLWSAVERLGPKRRSWLVALWYHTVGRLSLKGNTNWSKNISLATGQQPTKAVQQQAVAWWLRNLLESITLPYWSKDQIRDAVLISDDDFQRLLAAFNSTGAVLALGHLGSWDLCGAWVCQQGMPVSSVAEHLPDVRFQRFLTARAELGMQIYPLGEKVFDQLLADIKHNRLVCLLADRDLKGTGVAVNWPTKDGGIPITVPPGPALLALRSGAQLFVVTSYYQADKLHIDISDAIPHETDEDGLVNMMQRVITIFASEVTKHPADWHVFGRFFKQ